MRAEGGGNDMPKLDFLTLYIVIFLNSLTVCIIWAAVALSYRTYRPPRIWLGSTLFVLAGGIILSLQGNEGAFWPAVIGNTVIIYGFCLSWVGARYFYGESGGWKTSLAIALGSFSCMAASYASWEARNIVYAVGQSIPMAMIAIYVLGQKRIGLGGAIAVAALALGVAGHAIETTLNVLAWFGGFDQTLYSAFESYALVCVIYSGVVWNFGFIVLAMNRQHSEMVRMAEIDELTGLPNRRHFMNQLQLAGRRSAASDEPYALMLIDIDNFKRLNDEHGHAAGDQALLHFADVASAILKAPALLARTGGDEFTVLLPGMDEAAATEAAQDLIALVRRAPLVSGGRRMPMTVSIGIAAHSGRCGVGPEELLNSADVALYRVKQTGRDGYAVGSQSLEAEGPAPARSAAGR